LLLGLETGVQARPSFGPPLHLLVVGSQIGQGCMKVLHFPPPGQSALVMQPLPLLVPPEQAPVSHVADTLQSASEQHAAPVSVHRPVSLTQVPPGHEPGVTVPHPPPAAQPAPGVDPPEHRIDMRSPARKIFELSGRLKFVITPVLQSPVPEPSAETVLMTQVLVAAERCEPFGSGSGGPKRQPAFVHFRKLHLPPGQSAFVVQLPLWFEPPAQRLPPASAASAAVNVRQVPAHEEMWEVEVPLSGTVNGSGTPTPAPPT